MIPSDRQVIKYKDRLYKWKNEELRWCVCHLDKPDERRTGLIKKNVGESVGIYIGYWDTKGRLMENSWSVMTWCHQCVSPVDTFTRICIGDS